ncbi:hypothetical protein CDAR_74441 [Caerostris darwini]|uniref:Uncharacterized protein n=1 Tax=Caerostris darwini TaxID=1538125 RepID=A0AAV4Q0K8_9ARAC|nr:hypothetical protein CDAR_74441 [Caerostris darwini]
MLIVRQVYLVPSSLYLPTDINKIQPESIPTTELYAVSEESAWFFFAFRLLYNKHIILSANTLSKDLSVTSYITNAANCCISVSESTSAKRLSLGALNACR